MLLICSPRQMEAYWQIPRVHLGVRGVSPNFRPAKSSVGPAQWSYFVCPCSSSARHRIKQQDTERETDLCQLWDICDISFLYQGTSVFIQGPTCATFVADVPMQTTLAHWGDSWQSLCKGRGLLHTGQSAAGRTRSDCSKGPPGLSCSWSRASLGHSLGGLGTSQLWAVYMCMQI